MMKALLALLLLTAACGSGGGEGCAFGPIMADDGASIVAGCGNRVQSPSADGGQDNNAGNDNSQDNDTSTTTNPPPAA